MIDQTVSAFGGFLEAVTDQVRRLRGVRDDMLHVADDTVRAVLNGEKLYAPWQQEYSKVFRQWLQDPRGETMRINQAVNDLQVKDTTIASNASGGFGVPKQLAATIDSLARPVCPLLDPDILGALEVNTSDYHQPTAADLGAATAGHVGETGTRSATGTATFADRVPAFGTYYGYVTVSQHAREDIGDRLEAFLASEFSAQVGAQLMTDIVSGTGSGQVLGLTHTAPVTTVDFASPMRSMDALQYQVMAGASVVLGDIENLLGNFNENYLTADDFTLIMRPSTWFKLWGVGRSGTGSVEAPFRMPKFMPTLYGQRVALSGNAPAATSNQFPILAGSWKRGYVLVTRGPAMLTVDEVTVPGQVKYHYRIRYGGAIRAGNALKLLKWATS